MNGANLTADHIAAHVRAELYYVTQGGGYWILGAGGARGEPGPAGPSGRRVLSHFGHDAVGLPGHGTGTPVHNFGQIAPNWRGNYAAATTYNFLDLVRSGSYRYLHVGLAETTGTAVTDTTVWQRMVPEAAIAFSALTFAAALPWNVDTHPNATLEMTDDVTGITVTGDEDGGVYEMRIAQDATGSQDHGVSHFVDWLWLGGTAGVLSTAANAVDTLILRRMGSALPRRSQNRVGDGMTAGNLAWWHAMVGANQFEDGSLVIQDDTLDVTGGGTVNLLVKLGARPRSDVTVALSETSALISLGDCLPHLHAGQLGYVPVGDGDGGGEQSNSYGRGLGLQLFRIFGFCVLDLQHQRQSSSNRRGFNPEQCRPIFA